MIRFSKIFKGSSEVLIRGLLKKDETKSNGKFHISIALHPDDESSVWENDVEIPISIKDLVNIHRFENILFWNVFSVGIER